MYCEKGRHKLTELTHLDAQGNAHMVDVTDKQETHRTATASGKILLTPDTIALLRGAGVPKGDAVATARIAGIMAAKRTSELIPLCHPLMITKVTVDLTIEDDGVAVSATVKVKGQTGVEMEALTAVSAACLTLYDMVKAVDKAAVITEIRLEQKSGGKSGDFDRETLEQKNE
jgi:cyclic pyranopterin monophosphate synthase